MKRCPHNKIILSEAEEKFLRENFYKMTNKELATALGLKSTIVRTKCYKMGLKRIEMEYWTPEQVEFLKTHYKTIGDIELTEIFTTKWKKNKGWTEKHIAKKRKYLKLKRTPEEIKAIRERNSRAGRYTTSEKAWKTRGVIPIGEIRVWEGERGAFGVVKTAKGFVHRNPWLWRQHYGRIPKGMVVKQKEGTPLIAGIEDLELISRAELTRRNAEKYHSYPEELKKAIKFNNRLTKILKENGK